MSAMDIKEIESLFRSKVGQQIEIYPEGVNRFKIFLHENVAPERVKFNYTDPVHDADGKYPVDCRVNGMAKPLFIFGISNEDKCRDVTISLMWFEKHGIPHHPIAVFEDQEEINRKVLARFSDVVEKQFSSLSANRDRIKKYFTEFGVQHA